VQLNVKVDAEKVKSDDSKTGAAFKSPGKIAITDANTSAGMHPDIF
jgi:hypothetical protein